MITTLGDRGQGRAPLPAPAPARRHVDCGLRRARWPVRALAERHGPRDGLRLRRRPQQ